MGEENKNPVEAKAEENTTAQSTVDAQQASENIAEAVNNFNNTADTTGEYDQADIEANKIYAILAYIGILWLVGLLAAKDSKFTRFHVNQGIILCIVEAIVGAICAGLEFATVTASLVTVIDLMTTALDLLTTGLAIYGIYNALTGRAKELPVIGKYRILK